MTVFHNDEDFFIMMKKRLGISSMRKVEVKIAFVEKTSLGRSQLSTMEDTLFIIKSPESHFCVLLFSWSRKWKEKLVSLDSP